MCIRDRSTGHIYYQCRYIRLIWPVCRQFFYSSHHLHTLNRVRVVHHVHDLIQVERSVCLIGSVVQLFASDFVCSIFYSLLFLFNPRSLELVGAFFVLISMAFLINNLESFNKAIVTIVHSLDFPFFFFIFFVLSLKRPPGSGLIFKGTFRPCGLSSLFIY